MLKKILKSGVCFLAKNNYNRRTAVGSTDNLSSGKRVTFSLGMVLSLLFNYLRADYKHSYLETRNLH